MRADDPRHGTRRGYSAHYTAGTQPCRACMDAKNAYDAEARRLQAYGRWDPGFVDATEARAHIRALMSQGMSIKRIANRANLRPARVSYILYGRSGKPPARQIKREAAEALLSVPLDALKVDALGARRRLQALARLGYNQRLLARHIRTTQGMVWEITHASPRRLRITVDTFARIDAVYRDLCMSLPPVRTAGEKRAASRTRSLAERQGWLPPLAWDDIDDPNERPKMRRPKPRPQDDIDDAIVFRALKGEHLDMTPAERRVVVHILRDQRGWSEKRIKDHTGITQSRDYNRYPREETAA